MNFPLPGGNRIKVRGHVIYASNTATENLLTIPIGRDGNAGKIGVRLREIQADDFAFAANGDLYIAENALSKLVRVKAGGDVTTLATESDGLDNPSAVAFDPRPHRRNHLYITNSAYFGTHPSLQETTTCGVDATGVAKAARVQRGHVRAVSMKRRTADSSAFGLRISGV